MIRFLAGALLVCFTSAQLARAQTPPLKLEITTKLGVKTVVNVGFLFTDDDILDRVGGSTAFGSALTLRTGDDGATVIPWKFIRDVTYRDGRHVVAQSDGTEHVGKLVSQARSADDNDKVYDLSTATAIKVLYRPSAAPVVNGPRQKPVTLQRWRLTVGSAPAQIVTRPRLAFRFYSSSGYLIGGSTRANIGPGFTVFVDGERVPANLDDFESVELGGTREKPTITVKAKGAEPVSGALELKASDDRGSHEASAWAVVADSVAGGTLVLQAASCKLERELPGAAPAPKRQSSVGNAGRPLCNHSWRTSMTPSFLRQALMAVALSWAESFDTGR